MPALEETDDLINDKDISATLSRHVDVSLCIHWSLVFIYWQIYITLIEIFLGVNSISAMRISGIATDTFISFKLGGGTFTPTTDKGEFHT